MAPVLVVAAILLSSCGSDDKSSETGGLAGMVRTPALSVADVALPDAGAGDAEVKMKAPDDELMLVYFGDTFCPDICPTTMSDISVALNDLPAEQADRITVAMVTVDPDRDTGEVLTAYLGHFFDRSMALRTDDVDAIDAAAKAFGVRYEVADHQRGDMAYEVSHSAVTYVVDDTGSVVVEWPFGMDSLDMTADIKTLLSKETP